MSRSPGCFQRNSSCHSAASIEGAAARSLGFVELVPVDAHVCGRQKFSIIFYLGLILQRRIDDLEFRKSYCLVGREVGVPSLEKGVGGDFHEVGGEAAHGEVHLGQLVGGGGELLPVDGDVLGVAVVAADELEGLHEHAA